MTIKHTKKNVSAENQYVLTDVVEQNNSLVFTVENLQKEVGDTNRSRTLSFNLRTYQLKTKKTTMTHLEELENSQDPDDIEERKQYIFLVPRDVGGETVHYQYIWVTENEGLPNESGSFEGMGTVEINMDSYLRKIDVYNNLNYSTNDNEKALSAYQGKLLNDNKVDKVSGKSLSSEDFTTAEKTKLGLLNEPGSEEDKDSFIDTLNDVILDLIDEA